MPTQGGTSIGVSSVGVNASKTVLKPKSAFSASLGYNNLRPGVRGERDFLLDQNRIAPRLTAAYKTGRESQVSASWGVFYQSPEDTLLLRNAALGFERAQHYILNYQVSREQRIFRVEAFYKQYRELVRRISEYTNSGNGYAQGVELFFRIFERTNPHLPQPQFAMRQTDQFVWPFYRVGCFC